MATKLTPIGDVGDEYAVIIDKETLKKVGIAPDMNLEVSAEDNYIVITVKGWERVPRVPPDPGWRRPPMPRPEPPTPEPEIRLPKKQPW